MAAPLAGLDLRQRAELGLLRDHAAAHDVQEQGARAALRDPRGEGAWAPGAGRGGRLPQQVRREHHEG